MVLCNTAGFASLDKLGNKDKVAKKLCMDLAADQPYMVLTENRMFSMSSLRQEPTGGSGEDMTVNHEADLREFGRNVKYESIRYAA